MSQGRREGYRVSCRAEGPVESRERRRMVWSGSRLMTLETSGAKASRGEARLTSTCDEGARGGVGVSGGAKTMSSFGAQLR